MSANGNGNSQQQNVDLMRMIGSTRGYDPIPPDQYLTYQDQRYAPKLRLWAWMLSRTIRQGYRSPHAVDQNGHALGLQHAAADLGMDVANVYRAWRELEVEGRVKREGNRLRICGDVRLPESVSEKGEDEANKIVCTDNLPTYILKQIKELSPELREKFLRRKESEERLEKSLIADFTASVRIVFTQRQDTLFREFGLKKIREEHPARAKQPPNDDRRERINAIVPVVEKFVQTTFDFSVQTQNGVCTKSDFDLVQTTASLLTTEKRERVSSSSGSIVEGNPTATTTTNDQTPERNPILKLAALLNDYGPADLEAAERLFSACRELDPSATVEQVMAVVERKGPLAHYKKNPVGFLLVSVPKVFRSPHLIPMPQPANQSTAGDDLRLRAEFEEYRESRIAAEIAARPAEFSDLVSQCAAKIRSIRPDLPEPQCNLAAEQGARSLLEQRLDLMSWEEFRESRSAVAAPSKPVVSRPGKLTREAYQ